MKKTEEVTVAKKKIGTWNQWYQKSQSGSRTDQVPFETVVNDQLNSRQNAWTCNLKGKYHKKPKMAAKAEL